MLILVSHNLIICNRIIQDRPHVGQLFPFLSAVTLIYSEVINQYHTIAKQDIC